MVVVVEGPIQCGGMTRQVRALGSPRSAFWFILYSFGYPELGPDMTTEGRKAASIPEVTWLSLLAQKHTVLSPDLQMHFKRLPNETKAKQLGLCKPLCGAGVGENRGCLSQPRGLGVTRMAQDALGWNAWVHGDPVNLDTQRLSPCLHQLL